MSNKVQFSDGFGDKPNVNKNDRLLIADGTTGAPFRTTVDKLTAEKVDKESGKSLVPDTAISKLNDLPNKTQYDIDQNKKVDKVAGKELIDTTSIDKLNALPTNEDLDDALETKVDKVAGKQLSDNNYDNEAKRKVDILYTNGDGKFYLSDDGTYKKLNSNGGGFYNVTAKHPLASGQYYTINTAVGALANAEIEDADKEALIITFETSANVWTEYRFIGDISGFLTVANWVEYVDRDVVKGVLFNDEQLNPDSNGNVIINVNTNVEQTINPNSTDPVASSAVASEFAGLSAKYGTALSLSTVGDPENKVYQMNLLDEQGNVLSTTDQFSGGGTGGGETQTTKVVLNKITPNPTVKKGDLTELSFSYDHIDSTNQTSTGLGAKAIVTILSGALSKSREINLNAGSTTTLDVTNDLIVGNNTVRVRVEVDNGESIQVSTISWSVLVVNLVLTSNYDYATATAKGTTIYVPYTLAGAGNKTLKCYVNGLAFDSKSITTSNSNGSFAIPTSIFNHGNIDVQLVAELETNTGAVIKSNSIYYDLIITQPNVNIPVVATKFNYQDGTILASDEKPYLASRQLEDYTIQYAVFHPNQINKLVTIKVDGNTISTANVGFVQSKVTYRSVVAGTFNAVINVGNYNYQFNIVVSPSSVALTEPSDNMVFKFNAQAKSNSDIGKETWLATNGVTTATLSNVKFGGDGWLNNTLRLTDNGRASINYKPLDSANRLTNNAWTFQVRFRTSEVVDDNAQVIKSLDSEGTGFVITPTEVKQVTRGKAEVSMKLASGEIYNIALVSYPTANADSSDHEKLNDRISYLYINGIVHGIVQRASADQIYQQSPQNVILGANGATTEIFNIRHYNRYLNDSQILDLHMIDLDSVDLIIDTYNANAIIDGNGQITVDNIASDMRYIIITGAEANGVPSVLESAVQNNKDKRYDVIEMLHIKKSEPALNWKLIGGCIRLQGTSSLAYPIKNYRIYFKNSAKVAGQFYTGVDEQGNGGTLQSKAKWSFKTLSDTGKKPAPVDVWCLKADFAESSSSHNTGMARLLNNTLIGIGDLTPAQKHVDPNYQFDVRTTVDGEPCYLFYRASLTDTPVFLGKYNFNNDKSTEDVFGFTDILGYHTKEVINPETQEIEVVPSDWIINKFEGKNITECWEFLNNDYNFGKFQDDDFDRMVDVDGELIPDWTRVFENRFPDNQDEYMDGTKKPFYLERLVKWVKSTQSNLPKFKAELKDYFDVNYLCDYFVFTQVFGAVDQMVKNAMLGFWYNPDVDKMLGYYIYYDGDTIMGVRNDGKLKYNWDIDRNTLDPELSTPSAPSYAFMGHDSVLWNNLEAEFATEIGEAYKRMRTKMTNDDILNMFNDEQSDKYVERTFNIDAMNKYVKPLTLGIDVLVNGQVTNQKYSFLESSQGNRKSHRQWWLTNRLNLFDAKYATGLYNSTDITWKGFSSAGARVKATPARDFYFQVKRESTSMTHAKVYKDVEWSYTYPQDANIGTIFHLLGGNYMSKLDLSLWGGFTDLSLPRLPVLQELTLGAEGRTYSLTQLAITDKVPMLKKLDIRNYIELPSLDLSQSNRLEELIATGCTTLSTINFASGAPIKNLRLPNNLKTLHLNNFAQLTNSGIVFPNGNNVQILNIENCPLINWQTLYTAMVNTLTHVRIDGINLTGGVSFFNQFSDKGGISETGTLIEGKPALVGKYQFTTYVEETQFEALKAKYPYLELKQPEYSEVRMYDLDPSTKDIVIDTKNIFNPENNTGYGTVNKYQPSGHILKLLNNRHRYLGKQGADGVMNLIQLHDENSYFYADASNIANATPAKLDGTEGDVFVKEPKYWYRGINDVENGVNYIQVSSNDSKPSIHSSNIRITQAEFTAMGNIEGNFYLDSDKATSLTNAKTANSDYMIVKVNVEGFKFIKFPMTSQAYANLYNGTVIKCSSMFTDGADSIIKVMAPSSDDIEYNPKYAVAIPANAKWLYISMKKVHFSDDVMLTKGTKIQDVECDWIEHRPTLIGAVKSSITGNKVRSISGGAISELPKDLIDPYYTNKGVTRMVYDDYRNVAILAWLKYGERKTNDVFGQLEMQNITTGAQLYGTALQYGMMDTIEHPTSNHNGNGFPARKYVDEFGVTQYQTVSAVLSLGYENWTASEYSRFKEILFDGLPYQGNSKIRTFNVGTPMERNVHEFRPFQGIPRKRVLGKYLDIFPMGTKLGSATTFYSEGNDWYNEGDRRYMVIGYSNGQTGYSIGDINLHNESKISARIVFRGAINEITNAVNFKNIQGWK